MQPQPTFRDLCHRHRLAATHQRQVIFETVQALPGHPSPEMIYEKVRKQIPSISLATVYKNIRTFIDSGLLREVSLHHGSLRVETNRRPHHHLVCIDCKSITDFDSQGTEQFRPDDKVLRGFQVERITVDILGVCKACSARRERKTASKSIPNS
jgi:Fur family peroxide stress response transcriptional regulator